ncbi:uncharacterized protein LOC143297784 isoform X2 [Babylonia areolata]|uniref:uncharacterized protein LOC143297784 isoform X2 n=1 Tax=Babylonia areolata TaxID=304850 RepID=UPI003FD1CE51
MATGTKLMQEISDQFLVCKVCLEPFHDPKTLSCLHTFCCACIQQHYDAESTSRSTRFSLYAARAVTCPVCRKKTELPTGGVRRLPDNFLVSNLTDVLAKRRCRVSKVPPCEICHTVRSRSSDACSKCLDCDKLLCKACVELHGGTKVTQDHSLIDLQGQKDIECKAHPEETVRFYCEKCEECICVVCTFQEHKAHDVCSFSDGLSKHRAVLEDLLGRSKERLRDVSSRLDVIDKVETLSKELKERIRDLAISYTSQVRAREKELIRRVDEVLGGEVGQLKEKKAWLQESLDSLQSTCNLTEMVVKDRGVEMLLLKKEVEGKLQDLLSGSLPPEPPRLPHLDLTFVPGEVRLGDIYIPGEERGVGTVDKKVTDLNDSQTSSDGRELGENVRAASPCSPCRACLKRKRQEEGGRGRGSDGEDRTKRERSTRSVHVQTKPQETSSTAACFPATASQAGGNSTSVGDSHNSTDTHTATPPSSCRTDSTSRHATATRPPHRARGTMTARQDVRTLKVQTEDSCLRDLRPSHTAASGGSAYPDTDVAFFTRNAGGEEGSALTGSWPVERGDNAAPFAVREMRDAQVATDISLSLTATSTADAVTVLLNGEGGGGRGGGVGVSGGVSSDHGKPDLLAETGIVAVPTPTSTTTTATSTPTTAANKSPWIRSRKVQTDISALEGRSCVGEDQCIIDDDMTRAVFVSSGSSSRGRSSTSSTLHRDTASSSLPSSSPPLTPRAAPRPSCCDVGVVTSFKVKVVQDAVDRDTMTEAMTSQGTSGKTTTSVDTRTVYIQTLTKRLRSTAAGTDYEGQRTQSTCTQPVSATDAGTSMPQVLHESRTTWTDAVMTSERATSAAGPPTCDAVTLTTQVPTLHAAVQMRPESGEASTNTLSANLVHRQSQASPLMTCRGTVPDPSHLPALQPGLEPEATCQQPHGAEEGSTFLSGTSLLSGKPDLSGKPVLSGTPFLSPVPAESAGVVDRGTEMTPAERSSIATGPSCQMFSCRTVSTDTLHLLQVSEKETCTPAVKTVDDWTLTLQPQMINTGVTPPRPATIEVGVATSPVTLMHQATHTEVKTLRDSGTDSSLSVCDSETLTEKTLQCDAQTGTEVLTETQSTCMDVSERADGSCMTEETEVAVPVKETHDVQCQCQCPAVANKEVNTTRFRRKAKEVQTSYSYVECLLCQHPDKLEQLAVTKTFTDTSTDPSPPDTHDVATMALSCLASSPSLVHTGVQTSVAALYDKGVVTSFDFDEEFDSKPFPGLECQDAATSTESLPYIGLLSEIDVDELIVIPEANFELVSDSDEDTVSMVDDETLTEMLDYVEVGTQTVLPGPGPVASPEHTPVLLRQQEDCSKHLVSVGVNTLPKVTFEKETCTPIRHLFSKGTMTFFVAKMDKATSTISQTRTADLRQGAAAGGRVVKDASRQKATDSKVTMTHRTEHRDMAVETDSSLVDGRITQCISKLRHVSERLNSPTLRKTVEGDVFFGHSFLAHRSRESSSVTSPTSPKYLSSPTLPPRDSSVFLLSPPRDVCAEEAQRQTQLHNLLAETDAVLKSRESLSGRKAQPITTLKTPSPDAQGDIGHYASKSFPRPRSLDRQNRVKMGSQATSPSRLPLSRYHSAPGRIATVPAQTLLRKTGQTSPRTSPSKIPVGVSQKPAATMSTCTTPDTGPESDSYSTSSSTQKVQQRPSLPSISETRTPSSCSETSYVSMESGESSLNPQSLMTTSHSRTPSNVTTVSDTASEVMHAKGSAETLSTDYRESNEDDSSSACSASTALMVTPTQGTSSASPGKPKKEKKGFMHRFLPGKKKKDNGSSHGPMEGASRTEDSSELKQPPPAPSSPSPQVKKKQAAQAKAQKGARSKKPQKSEVTKSKVNPVEVPSPLLLPPPPVSTSASSGSSTPDSAQSPVGDGTSCILAASASAAGAAAPTPAMPPHHYPPLPDPNKTPPPPRKPRPFVYVRQRIFSIQQDNVEEAKERKEKEKEEKEKEEKKEKHKEENAEHEEKMEEKKEGQQEEEEKETKENETEEEKDKAAECTLS